MIDIETIKTIATEDLDINWSSETVLELIHRLESAESKQILGASARHFKQMEAAESQQVAQELVIKQLRDALIHHQKLTRPIDRSYEALAIPTSTEHLEAWYTEMVGEPVAWNYELTEEAFVRLSVAGINMDTPLHVIKPFPFKGE